MSLSLAAQAPARCGGNVARRSRSVRMMHPASATRRSHGCHEALSQPILGPRLTLRGGSPSGSAPISNAGAVSEDEKRYACSACIFPMAMPTIHQHECLACVACAALIAREAWFAACNLNMALLLLCTGCCEGQPRCRQGGRVIGSNQNGYRSRGGHFCLGSQAACW